MSHVHLRLLCRRCGTVRRLHAVQHEAFAIADRLLRRPCPVIATGGDRCGSRDFELDLRPGAAARIAPCA